VCLLCSTALAAEGFNAGLTVERTESTITVTVQNSSVLADKQPTLSIPCDFEYVEVTFGGEKIEAVADGTNVSFTVAAGGTYVISLVDKPAAGPDTEPDTEPESKPDPDPTPTPTPPPAVPVVPPVADTDSTDTTTNADGSVTTVTEHKNGSVTETTVMPDGTSGTVTTDKHGTVTEVKAEIAPEVKPDAVVTLPVEVPVASKSSKAPEIEITVPATVPEVTVEIPAPEATETTVVVLVHPDGSEEILPKAALTEDGVAVPLEGSATLKLVDNAKQFSDTHSEDIAWAKDAIDFVAARELFVGNEGKFDPQGGMNRAMLATVLWRLEGCEDASVIADFDDVVHGEWYAEAVHWANENDIIRGYGDTYGTTDLITREQLATMLYRLSGQPRVRNHIRVDGASDWAADAMAWAVETGLLQGNGSSIDPQAPATRAQVAIILQRYVNMG